MTSLLHILCEVIGNTRHRSLLTFATRSMTNGVWKEFVLFLLIHKKIVLVANTPTNTVIILPHLKTINTANYRLLW